MSISTPTKITVPFANTGSKNTIPVPSQISVTPGAASYTDGFPPLTMTPKASGGVPPFGQDMNGILYAITQAVQYSQAGGTFSYDSTYASAVGGYPAGAVVMATDYSGFWINTTANNTSDPEALGAGWVPYYQTSGSLVSVSSSNVTLTALQAGKALIRISGSLTTNLNIIFPTWVKEWLVVNNASGNYVITAKTASGSGVSLAFGSNHIYGDGTNIYTSSAGLGINQSWYDLTSSRALATTYTNNSGSPIQIMVSLSDTVGFNPSMSVVVNGVNICNLAYDQGGAFGTAIAQCVIPNGATYSVTATNGTLSKWSELR